MAEIEEEVSAQTTPTLGVQPTAAEIVRWRMAVAILLRLGAVLAALLMLWPITSWLIEGIRDDDLFSIYFMGNFILLVILLVVAVFMYVGARFVPRWLVPIPAKPLCPGCGFNLIALQGPTCPECGLNVLGAGPSTDSAGPSYARWHAAAILTIRMLALLLLGFGTLGSLAWLSMIIMFSSDVFGSGEDIALIPALVTLLLQIAPGPVAWIYAPRIATFALRGAVAWPPSAQPDTPKDPT